MADVLTLVASLAVVAVTLLVILPTNKRLLDRDGILRPLWAATHG